MEPRLGCLCRSTVDPRPTLDALSGLVVRHARPDLRGLARATAVVARAVLVEAAGMDQVAAPRPAAAVTLARDAAVRGRQLRLARAEMTRRPTGREAHAETGGRVAPVDPSPDGTAATELEVRHHGATRAPRR
ncbi:MAG: hypothetical protein QOE09_1188 [Ilumatobacteraceae bacterium]|jgi:hypothetical protein